MSINPYDLGHVAKMRRDIAEGKHKSSTTASGELVCVCGHAWGVHDAIEHDGCAKCKCVEYREPTPSSSHPATVTLDREVVDEAARLLELHSKHERLTWPEMERYFAERPDIAKRPGNICYPTIEEVGAEQCAKRLRLALLRAAETQERKP